MQKAEEHWLQSGSAPKETAIPAQSVLGTHIKRQKIKKRWSGRTQALSTQGKVENGAEHDMHKMTQTKHQQRNQF